MSWAQAILLARGLSRGWGGICGTALTGAPFSQVPPQALRSLHCSTAAHRPDSSLVPCPPKPPRRPVKALARHEELFRQAPDAAQDKASFVRAVQNFTQHNVHKRGHIDFIYLALRKMREYGVERDLAVYNLLLDIFPKEVFRPRSIIQKIFIHYPRQQECGIAVLEQMENHGVMPNKETEFLLIQIFGRKSYPMLKLVRMKLWFTRFKNINPFPVPRDLPQDPIDLARLALRHMEPNLSARVTIYQMPLPKDATDAADPTEPHIVVEEGPVFAICMTGAHDQATLAKWIQGLQETNPALAQIPVVFRLAGSSGELLASSSGLEEPLPPPPPPEGQEEEENSQQRQQQGQS
ncbi:evolutionarily conserved signaling intermediate in Toll pathway, mitochondrial isoform X2 [Camelus ferus]|uniref:Evolutionarily conserved signaling intermediate in Toll pathway, mitochondrial n=1 Tax=Camelus ferus TaxID=419612 RepID=A0A8B8RUI3_CAMFR|nr:evolutionarily conserved signaling intermediate in Toll pathway, mitochondrial isoform X2 [Camelus dromedarius]XP_032321618.1 evolutionarily conserved signaling intermediate in Toll pathway, mitochondrial isoform X2 [Camelus ferus]